MKNTLKDSTGVLEYWCVDVLVCWCVCVFVCLCKVLSYLPVCGMCSILPLSGCSTGGTWGRGSTQRGGGGSSLTVGGTHRLRLVYV
jgi:hypothetical protein